MYEPQKEIIQEFEFSEKGWREALEKEKSIIRPSLRDPFCLNENCGGMPSPRRMKSFWDNSPELKEKVSDLMRKLSLSMWEDPDFRSRRAKTSGSTLHKLWQNEDFRTGVCQRNKARAEALKKNFEELELPRLFELLKNSDIDLSQLGWVGKVAKLWGVSHTKVRRIFDTYWTGPTPYQRSKSKEL